MEAIMDTIMEAILTGCAYTATIGDPGKVPSKPGFITVSGGTAVSSMDDVQVQTFDKSGAPR
jgi:hypothetical protein